MRPLPRSRQNPAFSSDAPASSGMLTWAHRKTTRVYTREAYRGMRSITETMSSCNKTPQKAATK